MLACGGHCHWPFQRGLEALGCAQGVVLGHAVGVVESFVEEGTVEEVFGVVITRAEKRDLDVEDVGVLSRRGVEIGGEHQWWCWCRYRW